MLAHCRVRTKTDGFDMRGSIWMSRAPGELGASDELAYLCLGRRGRLRELLRLERVALDADTGSRKFGRLGATNPGDVAPSPRYWRGIAHGPRYGVDPALRAA